MFEKKEVLQLILAVLLITYLIMFSDFTLVNFFVSLVFAFLLLVPHVIAHKIAAEYYLAESKFKFFEWKRFWFFEDSEFKNPVPIWIILPVLAVFLTQGIVKIFTIETCDITWKAERRIGRWFVQLQEHEIASIALAGPIVNLFFAFIGGVMFSITGLVLMKQFAILNAWFAFFSLLPIGSLDGTKVLFGGMGRWVFVFVFTIAILVLLHFISIYVTLIIALIFAAIITLWFLRTDIPEKRYKTKPGIIRGK